MAERSLNAVQTMCWTLGAMLVGSALHPLMQAARRNNWCAACNQASLALLSVDITLPEEHTLLSLGVR